MNIQCHICQIILHGFWFEVKGQGHRGQILLLPLMTIVTNETKFFHFPLNRSSPNWVGTFKGRSHRSSSKETLKGQRSRSQRSNDENHTLALLTSFKCMVFNENGYEYPIQHSTNYITRVLTWGQRSRSQRSNNENHTLCLLTPFKSMDFNGNGYEHPVLHSTNYITRVLTWGQRSSSRRSDNKFTLCAFYTFLKYL